MGAEQFIPDCSYEDFPYSERTGKGMQTLDCADWVPEVPQVELFLNVPYRTCPDRELVLHVVMPGSLHDPAPEPHPLVVYVPGSAFHRQRIDRSLPMMTAFAGRGYTVAVVEYRESDIEPFPAQAMDAKYAIQYLMEHAEEYRIAPGRLGVWGDSSGAHTALACAFTAGRAGFTAPDLVEYPIVGACGYYPPTAFYEMGDEPSICPHRDAMSPEGVELGGVEVTPETSRAADLRTFVDGCAAPVLLMAGDKDRTVPFGQSCLLNDALVAAGADVTFYRLHGADHGDPVFWSAPALDLVAGFFDRCFGATA